MKALTISQPYASLIADGSKWIENRTWPTNYRGPLAIHAGLGTQYMTKKALQLSGLPYGSVVAVAELQSCQKLRTIRNMAGIINALTNRIDGSNRTWEEADEHEHAEGPYCWILGNVRKIEPIEARGAQGLWVPSQELRDAIEAAAMGVTA